MFLHELQIQALSFYLSLPADLTWRDAGLWHCRPSSVLLQTDLSCTKRSVSTRLFPAGAPSAKPEALQHISGTNCTGIAGAQI